MAKLSPAKRRAAARKAAATRAVRSGRIKAATRNRIHARANKTLGRSR